MGKHSKKDDKEPTPGTMLGIPFSKMSGTQKAMEFDASAADPKGYAKNNFTDQNRAPEGKHKRG